jgi:hypothetical protein
MENINGVESSDPRVAIADAEAARARLVGALELPSFFYASIAAAITAQIALAAAGIAWQDTRGVVLASIGVVIFVAVCAIQLNRFRRLNGVWVAGLLSRVMAGTAPASSVTYALSFAAATWVAFAQQWLLVALAAAIGGIAFAASGRHWWRGYREHPTNQPPAESGPWVATLASVAVAGAVLLVIGR